MRRRLHLGLLVSLLIVVVVVTAAQTFAVFFDEPAQQSPKRTALAVTPTLILDERIHTIPFWTVWTLLSSIAILRLARARGSEGLHPSDCVRRLERNRRSAGLRNCRIRQAWRVVVAFVGLLLVREGIWQLSDDPYRVRDAGVPPSGVYVRFVEDWSGASDGCDRHRIPTRYGLAWIQDHATRVGFDYCEAGDRFPNARSVVLNGCLPPSTEFARVRYCPTCRSEMASWRRGMLISTAAAGMAGDS